MTWNFLFRKKKNKKIKCYSHHNAVILFFLKLYSIFYGTICHAMHEKTCVFGEINFLADKR